MKILFWGETRRNSGPDNVNRNMIMSFSKTFAYPHSRNKILPDWTDICNLISCDIVVVSGLSRKGYAIEILAKLMRKKLVYIVHGYFEEECKLNCSDPGFGVFHERCLMCMADLILGVSQKTMQLIRDKCPQYEKKLNYLYNGIECLAIPEKLSIQKKRGMVSVYGALGGVKNNYPVVEAIGRMNGKAGLCVFSTDCQKIFPYTSCFSRLKHDDYIVKLLETELFVLNSLMESFSLSAVEALQCGCSLLISENAGITDILTLEESDIIHDPMNVDEIREKIEYLLEHPNNSRIMSKLNLNDYSYEKSAERLEMLCKELL